MEVHERAFIAQQIAESVRDELWEELNKRNPGAVTHQKVWNALQGKVWHAVHDAIQEVERDEGQEG